MWIQKFLETNLYFIHCIYSIIIYVCIQPADNAWQCTTTLRTPFTITQSAFPRLDPQSASLEPCGKSPSLCLTRLLNEWQTLLPPCCRPFGRCITEDSLVVKIEMNLASFSKRKNIGRLLLGVHRIHRGPEHQAWEPRMLQKLDSKRYIGFATGIVWWGSIS